MKIQLQTQGDLFCSTCRHWKTQLSIYYVSVKKNIVRHVPVHITLFIKNLNFLDKFWMKFF